MTATGVEEEAEVVDEVAVKEVEAAVDERMLGAAEDYAVGGEEAEVGEAEEEAAGRLWCGGNAMTFA